MVGSSALNQLSIEDIGLTTDHRNVTLAALSDPTRRLILARLRQGEATVGELAEPFALRIDEHSRPWEERRQRPDRHFQATAGKEDANV